MTDVVMVLTQGADGAFDFLCRECGGSARLHPDETFVAQVLMFFDQHRHEDADRLPT